MILDVQSNVQRPPNARTRAGGALVEAALTMTVFLMVLFGVAGFGRAIWAYSWTSHAAREATRWASVRGTDGAMVAGANDIETFVKAHMLGLDPAQVTVTTNWLPDNNAGSTVQVQIQYNIIQLVPWVPAMTVQSTSTMTIAQ